VFLDHIAVLTADIERFCTINQLESQEPIEVFKDSGSREQYIDSDGVGGRLLLMQPHGDGPYQRALTKRGPGLHHLGIAVADIASALEEWSARGWQVHPESENTMSPDFGAFLFQRGVSTLIELFVGEMDLGRPTTEVAIVADQSTFPAVVGVATGAESVIVRHKNRLLKMKH